VRYARSTQSQRTGEGFADLLFLQSGVRIGVSSSRGLAEQCAANQPRNETKS